MPIRPSMIKTVWLPLTAAVLLGVIGAPALAEEPAITRARAMHAEGESAYRLQDFRRALAAYREAWKLSQRPALLFNIAQCFRQLGERDQARFYYQLYLSDWERQRPGEAPPYREEVNEHLRQLATQKVEHPRSVEVPPQRNRWWLVTGIAAGALAVGAEAAAIVFTVKANDRFTDEPEFDTSRNGAIASHVVAGAMGAAMAASLVLYYASGRRAHAPAAAVAPLRDGAVVAASWRF